MYILIRNNFNGIKAEIKSQIDNGKIKTWSFVKEDQRTRLMHTGEDNQYNDVVLRFLTTHEEGIECLKIMPTMKKDAVDDKKAESHFGIVLGRFSELLNTHFEKIGCYETYLQ